MSKDATIESIQTTLRQPTHPGHQRVARPNTCRTVEKSYPQVFPFGGRRAILSTTSNTGGGKGAWDLFQRGELPVKDDRIRRWAMIVGRAASSLGACPVGVFYCLIDESELIDHSFTVNGQITRVSLENPPEPTASGHQKELNYENAR